MWFATLHIKACPLEWRWCYDRSSFIRNNILTFICFSCRNYYSICLNYTGYNFKQIDNKKHICKLSSNEITPEREESAEITSMPILI